MGNHNGARAVWVSGASGDLGQAMVRRLLSEGYRVFGGYYRNDKALAEWTEAYPQQFMPVFLDVSSEASVREAHQRISEQLEKAPLFGLINAAGVDGYALLQDVTLNEWRRIMETNVTGTFLLSRVVLPEMLRARSGVILNLSSIWGARGAAMEVAYSTSKGAVDAFTRALAQEVAWSGIRVNALAPGVVQGHMFAHLSPEDQADTLADIPFGRAATPQEIAAQAAFLFSDDAAYLTGQIITIAGGFVL